MNARMNAEDRTRELLYIRNLYYCIDSISDYCKRNQSCTKCLIKEWCKEKRKQCPEEWRKR